MFKSIQWKVLTVFVLLIISVMIVVGTFLLSNINKYYHDEFAMQMEQTVFIPELTDQLYAAANQQEPTDALSELMEVYIGRIGVDSFRNYYILDRRGNIIDGSDGVGGQITATQNLLQAMDGRVGDAVDSRGEVMDYAYPIVSDGGTQYIIYISDTKDEIDAVMSRIFVIIFWVLLLGLAMSIVLGLFLSRTIIAPIISLKKKAEKLAAGDFGSKIEVKSRDEIADLTVTFNTMAAELKQTLNDISAEKNKIETIFRFMTDGVMAFSRDGSILHINPAARKMLDIAEDSEIYFDSFFESIGVNVKLAEFLYLNDYKTAEKNVKTEDKDLKAYFAPFMTEGDRTDGVVVVFQDVTEQLKLDNSRREFVANVSHELRTPLTTVKSYAETLAENAEKGSMEQSFLDVINNETDRMTRLVKDLLTLSRLDYDKTALVKNTFPLQKLVEEIVRKLSMDARKHEHQLVFAPKGEMPPFYGDRDRLEQVITNIISNAVKYTPDGGRIEVGCDYFFTDAVITVKDNGIGIPEADLPRIFERFYRVDKARTRKFGGTGLGLAIAKEIVDAHGGKIEINSKQGKGTEVRITMPLYSE
ncbi:MAG: HAMP domain-containing protein [Clostridia bacterium]|nr:HAMP domain-containing protein [Clostridia bacterium]